MPNLTDSTNLTGLTPDQLRATSKAQIVISVTAALNAMTKRDLLIAGLGTDKLHDVPIVVYRKDGQAESQVETVRDVETGVQVSRRVTTWTYYEKGEVDEIAIVEYDAADKETARRTIKHFLDGKHPIATIEEAK